MRKIGNLFELARKQLEKTKVKFSPLNVIDRTIELRSRLDDIEVLKHRKSNKKHYTNKKSDNKS